MKTFLTLIITFLWAGFAELQSQNPPASGGEALVLPLSSSWNEYDSWQLNLSRNVDRDSQKGWKHVARWLEQQSRWTNGLGEPVLTTFGGSTFPGSEPVFMWGSVTSAVSYTLQYDTDVDFGSPTEVTGITTLDHTAASPLAGATYFWRVRAVGAGTAGGFSASDSFVIIPALEEWLVILLAMGMLGFALRRKYRSNSL